MTGPSLVTAALRRVNRPYAAKADPKWTRLIHLPQTEGEQIVLFDSELDTTCYRIGFVQNGDSTTGNGQPLEHAFDTEDRHGARRRQWRPRVSCPNVEWCINDGVHHHCKIGVLDQLVVAGSRAATGPRRRSPEDQQRKHDGSSAGSGKCGRSHVIHHPHATDTLPYPSIRRTVQCQEHVTLDDATSEHYSMFFVEEEGTASSFRGMGEVIEGWGGWRRACTPRRGCGYIVILTGAGLTIARVSPVVESPALLPDSAPDTFFKGLSYESGSGQALSYRKAPLCRNSSGSRARCRGWKSRDARNTATAASDRRRTGNPRGCDRALCPA